MLVTVSGRTSGLRARLGGAPRGLLVCEAYFVGYLLASFVYAALCPPASFAYDFSLLRAVLVAASSACSLWMLHTRRRDGRWVALATAVLCAVLCAIDTIYLGSMRAAARIVGLPLASTMAVVEIFGAGFVSSTLLLDHDLRNALGVRIDTSPAYEGGNSWDRPMRERVHTWEFWRDLALYFIVFSFLGHFAEILFCRLIIAGVFMGDYDPTNAMLWDQWLFPFSAEGTALAAVVVFLHPLARVFQKRFGERSAKAVALSFLANGAVCTSIDFITGITCNQNYQLWDYRQMPFNFMGQVCLQNSMVYTIAATLIVWVVYPLMDRQIRRTPRDVANAVFWGVAGAYGFLALLHFVDPSML
ncbi:MAG: putative ABC transporter permease [Atopobiaceae bacterium]|nr:putative ABC transporter permease [Atopobiaceae bacterium]